MSLFRFHKGSLDESMKTVVEANSKGDVANAFNDKFNACILPSDLKSSHYGYDDRVKWVTYIVLHKGSVIGFSNSELK